MNAPATANPPAPARIEVVDALRGSALAGILLLHATAHFGLMVYPPDPPAWLAALDRLALRMVSTLFAGKAYGLFALLFGFTFFLILDRARRRGTPYQVRFLRRLGLLVLMGVGLGLFYPGEFLLILAALGVPLLLLERLGNRALAVLSVLLLLQLPGLVELGRCVLEAGYEPAPGHAMGLLAALYPVQAGGSLLDVMASNLTAGRVASLTWNWEQMRYSQILGFYLWGLLLGRSRVLEDPVRTARFARRVLAWGLAGVGLLVVCRFVLGRVGLEAVADEQARAVLRAYGHVALVLVWAGGFVLLFQMPWPRRVLQLFAPAGRMSLTCYVVQGIVGVGLFYGFGFGLYRWLGALASLGVGMGLVVAQLVLARLWMDRFRFGPLEWLWRSATNADFSTPIRLPAAR